VQSNAISVKIIFHLKSIPPKKVCRAALTSTNRRYHNWRIGAAAVAAAEIYRAHIFEKDFWNWINKVIGELAKRNASISEPKIVEPSQKDN
jgi:hypothetical protein